MCESCGYGPVGGPECGDFCPMYQEMVQAEKSAEENK